MRAPAALPFFLAFLIPIPALAADGGPLVCVYYYPWYGAPDHPWVNVTDTPVLGFYNSSHQAVLARHLGWLRGLGVDCLFVSWWGPGHFTDEVAQRLFGLLPVYGLRAAVMVEPYLGGDPSLYNASWWNQTLTYIRERYIDRYPEAYLYLDGKPLVLAFNPIGMKYDPEPDFPAYAIRIVGNDVDNAGYQDWDLWPDYDSQLSGELRVRRDGYVALAPRFDDEHFRPGGVPPYDPSLTQGWYERQWEWVLGNRDQVRIVAIYSWNEFHERSMIEPANHREGGDPYKLYKLTQEYIQKLRQPEGLLGGARLGAAIGASVALLSIIVGFLVRLARS